MIKSNRFAIKRKKINTRRLILKPLELSDYSEWFDAHVNGLAVQSRWDMAPRSAQECSRKVYKKMLSRHDELERNDEYYRWSAFEKRSGLLVGHIDFSIFSRGDLQFANFGYQIYNRYWGNGYGQEAAKIGLKIGLTVLKLNRLEGAINLDNKKSIRLAKAIGMKKECIRKRYWREKGKWVDHYIYVAIKK